MTATDLLLLGVIGISTVLGLMRGFVGVVASLVAWVLAAWAAFRFGAHAALLMSGGGEPSASQLFAGSGIDRFMGMAMGLVRGGFVACLLVLLMGFTGMPREPGWRQSQVVPVLLPGAQLLRGLLPDWAAQRVDFGGY